jgi:hypothetical protein
MVRIEAFWMRTLLWVREALGEVEAVKELTMTKIAA